MRFDDPQYLVLGFAALLYYAASRHRTRVSAVQFSSLAGLRRLPRTLAQRVKRALPYVPALALLLLSLAAARPGVTRTTRDATTEGIAIQLVIDRSGSMLANDLDVDPNARWRRTRLDVVKDVVRDFIDDEEDLRPLEEKPANDLPGRPNDTIGLIAFAGYVQTLCPATLNHEELLRNLASVQAQRDDPRDPEANRTAIGDALATAVARLLEMQQTSKVAVLLSDGANNIGNVPPLTAADAAASEGIKVYTVGVGTRSQGLDEETMRAIAERTGGAYFHARNTSELVEVYHQIDQLERTESEEFKVGRLIDRYPPFLLVGLALFVLHTLLVSTRFRSLP